MARWLSEKGSATEGGREQVNIGPGGYRSPKTFLNCKSRGGCGSDGMALDSRMIGREFDLGSLQLLDKS